MTCSVAVYMYVRFAASDESEGREGQNDERGIFPTASAAALGRRRPGEGLTETWNGDGQATYVQFVGRTAAAQSVTSLRSSDGRTSKRASGRRLRTTGGGGESRAK